MHVVNVWCLSRLPDVSKLTTPALDRGSTVAPICCRFYVMFASLSFSHSHSHFSPLFPSICVFVNKAGQRYSRPTQHMIIYDLSLHGSQPFARAVIEAHESRYP